VGENRQYAPDLFARELRDTLEMLRTTPGAGVGFPIRRRPTLRRILMPRTQHHIYFRVDEKTKTIHILGLGGTPKAHPPKL
jgi:plasmid stabilization system protein ParE